MLIVDMPMPTKCGECPLLVMGVCMPLADIIGKTIEKTDKCPIKGELVRCRDCLYWDKEIKWMPEHFDYVCKCVLQDRWTEDDEFCSDGERKEQNDG